MVLTNQGSFSFELFYINPCKRFITLQPFFFFFLVFLFLRKDRLLGEGALIFLGCQHVAQLLRLSLGAHPRLDELECAPVLVAARGVQSLTSLESCPARVGGLVEVPSEPAVSRLADILCYLVAFVEGHRHGVVQGHAAALRWQPGQEDLVAFKTQDECTHYSSVG